MKMKLYRKNKGPFVVFAEGEGCLYSSYYDIGIWVTLSEEALKELQNTGGIRTERWELSEWDAADHYRQNESYPLEKVSWLELLLKTGISKEQLQTMIEDDQNGR